MICYRYPSAVTYQLPTLSFDLTLLSPVLFDSGFRNFRYYKENGSRHFLVWRQNIGISHQYFSTTLFKVRTSVHYYRTGTIYHTNPKIRIRIKLNLLVLQKFPFALLRYQVRRGTDALWTGHILYRYLHTYQCFGSGFHSDSIVSLDPHPDWDPQAKISRRNRKRRRNLMFGGLEGRLLL